MARDWRSAYFEQAHSDFRTLELLRSERAPACQCLHYLQMSTEKLAKGFLTPPGGPPYGFVHDAFVNFLRAAPYIPEIGRALRIRDADRIRAYIAILLPTAQEIEDLAPSIAGNAPNPEYPWSDAAGVYAPVEHSFPNLDFKSNPRLNKLVDFIEKCFSVV